MLAEELSEYDQAKGYYLQTLQIFAEFNDQYSVNITMNCLAGLYSKTQDNSLLTAVAQILDWKEDELKELFAQFRE